jgi:hypothetical protein
MNSANMIPLFVIASMMSATTIVAQSVGCNECKDAERLVGSVMAAATMVDLSFNEHQGRVLGDRVAIAIAQQFRLNDLRDTENGRRVLLLLGYAFADPASIQADDAKRPGVTLLLLDYLAERSPDVSIQRTAQELANKVKSWQRNPDR